MNSEVVLEISFADLLGNRRADMPDDVRRDRWEKWKAIAGEAAKYWSAEGCEGCIHLDGDWCKLQELPAAVNPYLSFRYGMPGMACMGVGKETREE